MFKLFKSEKKRYFEARLQQNRFKIYATECDRYQSKEMREEARQLFDAEKAKIAAAEEFIKAQEKLPKDDKTKLSHDELERKKDSIAKMGITRDGYEQNIKELDNRINGEAPSAENPLGTHGIQELLDAQHQTEELIKSYMNHKGL
jgi:hypothetical protein